ncbi:formyltetrahydrofolate deformylase [Candidatus Termititenax aidoneus]|uniref:Formyltetrahydrofolate deformylase n=1 Tax=Termititenax aidoneus TaxID=2218524 RepID=A0A388TB09_TERA1|nr:formyltetrahydrofolate deformylase [Candidatus Termititenax aidoneus]
MNAILRLTCRDCRGIVAAVTNFITRNNGNIVNLDQYTDPAAGQFFMRLEWDLAGFKLPRSRISAALQKFGKIAVSFSDQKKRAAIFVSKYDHCLYDLLLRSKSGELNCDITAVISNHEDLRYVAETFGQEFYCLPDNEKKQLALLKAKKADLLILARYMQILSPKFIRAYPHKIINVHHSFLPAFKGAKPYHQAYQRGVKIIGATAHFATEDLDQGPIIQQNVAQISHRDTVEDLITRGRDLERQVLSEAVRYFLNDRLFVCGQRTIIL